MAGANTPPITSPNPTTIPVAVVARRRGTAPLINGPTVIAMTPAFMKVATNNTQNSFADSASDAWQRPQRYQLDRQRSQHCRFATDAV
jgi:hypothetical protein